MGADAYVVKRREYRRPRYLRTGAYDGRMPAVLRPCRECGALTLDGAYCAAHAPTSAGSTVYGTARWHRLARRTVDRWIAAHGYVCPGFGRPAHRAIDLTADHVIPLASGGAPFDPRNVVVLCRACNGRKGSRL